MADRDSTRPSHDLAASSFPPALFAERDRDRETATSARMRVTCCHETGRTSTALLRGLDGDERRIVISCPWGQDPADTVAAIWNQLTPAEQTEVSAAFGLGQQEP